MRRIDADKNFSEESVLIRLIHQIRGLSLKFHDDPICTAALGSP
jgi:hypothetical protein